MDKKKRRWGYKADQNPLITRMSGAQFAAQLSEEVLKGDLPGHEFHGNQYTDGSGGGDSSSKGGSLPATTLGDLGFGKSTSYDMEKKVSSMKDVEKTLMSAYKTMEKEGWKGYDSFGGTDKAPEQIIMRHPKNDKKEVVINWDNDGKKGFVVGITLADKSED